MGSSRSVIRAARSAARATYEKLLAPYGRRALDKMLGDGLPAQLAPALRFLFTNEAPAFAAEAAARIERLRAEIGARPESYRFRYSDSPLGPVRLAERIQGNDGEVTSHRLAMTVSVPPRWGMFLHLCATGFDANTILEMGACVGISGSYFASAHTRPYLVTLEGSRSLAEIARESIASVSDRGEVIVGPFEQTLEPALNRLSEKGTVDVAFVDGHHEEAATLHYVAAIASRRSPIALMILDDIYLYEGMWRAWQVLSSASGVVAINVGRFGLLIYGDDQVGNRQYDLSRYTGRWRVGPARLGAG